MELNYYHLRSFSNSMIQYLNEFLVHKNCVSFDFRKNNIKNNENIEFSFFLKARKDSHCNSDKSFKGVDSSFFSEEELKEIIKVSKTWPLHLAEASLKDSKLCLKLYKPYAFYVIIHRILNQKSNYGCLCSNNKVIKVTCENITPPDLMNLLVSINKKIAINCLKAAGYELKDSDYVEWIHFTTRNEKTEDKVKTIILKANGNNPQTKCKETQMTTEKYLKLILNETGSISESKRLENSNEELAQNLADTSLKLCLIQIKANQFVASETNPNFGGLIKTACKRAVFLQYNVSRLVAIRKKYLELVADGKYPSMPSPENLDFTYLKEPEEWCLLFNFLLEYPALIERVADDFLSGKANSLQIFNFLSDLCSLYSTYYRRVRVLLEPKNHLLPLIFTRLVLAEAIEQILENGLALLDIKKIEKM